MTTTYLTISPEDYKVACLALKEYRRQAQEAKKESLLAIPPAVRVNPAGTVDVTAWYEEGRRQCHAAQCVGYVEGAEKCLELLGLPIPEKEE